MTLMRPKEIIRRRFHVDEEDKTAVFRHGRAEAAPIGGSSGNLFFLGMEGSGRRTLARAASVRLRLEYAEARDAPALRSLLDGKGRAVAVMTASLTEDPALAQSMRDSGKVFYLVRMPHELASRLGDASRAESLAGELARLDPLFMNAAHFILPSDETDEERIEDVAEKARL